MLRDGTYTFSLYQLWNKWLNVSLGCFALNICCERWCNGNAASFLPALLKRPWGLLLNSHPGDSLELKCAPAPEVLDEIWLSSSLKMFWIVLLICELFTIFFLIICFISSQILLAGRHNRFDSTNSFKIQKISFEFYNFYTPSKVII